MKPGDEIWIIPHPGTTEPILVFSFQEAMDKYYEGFNLPRRFVCVDDSPQAYDRVKQHLNKPL